MQGLNPRPPDYEADALLIEPTHIGVLMVGFLILFLPPGSHVIAMLGGTL